MFDLALMGLGTIVILVFGPRMARTAEDLADALGWTHAISGAMFLGLATSLSGAVMSASAAWRGDAPLAISNGLGGIAAQTVFLAIADFFHKRKNLEHDAGSVVNLFQIALLLVLMCLTVMAIVTPEVGIGIGPGGGWTVLHPVSIVLPVAWIAGQYLAHRTGQHKPWRPVGRVDADDAAMEAAARKTGLRRGALVVAFLVYGGLVAGAGYALSVSTPTVAARLGLSTSAVGFVLTATITSMPELVTTVTAVRRGALSLAVGNIVGGNTFDTLFASISDAAFRGGSVYHAIGQREEFVAMLGMLLSAILLMGLIGRERSGVARIGTEGIVMLAVYGLGAAAVVWWMPG